MVGPAYDHGQSNIKSGVYAQSFSPLGGGPYGKDTSKAEVILPIQDHLIAKELLCEHPNAEECIVLMDASIGESRADIQVYFDDNTSPDKDAATFVKNNLESLLNHHNIIKTHLNEPDIYDSIANHGLLGAVLGDKYRPPFKT